MAEAVKQQMRQESSHNNLAPLIETPFSFWLLHPLVVVACPMFNVHLLVWPRPSSPEDARRLNECVCKERLLFILRE